MKEHTYLCHIVIESDRPLTRDDLVAMVTKLAETVGDGTIEIHYAHSEEV
jgi:hypothetical protein